VGDITGTLTVSDGRPPHALLRLNFAMSLKERRDVVALCRDAEAGVLFSVVRVAGSSYRQPGARLVALPDGRTAGTLSGGCLEADLVRRAAWTVRDGAVIERFSTRFDDTAEIPYGLGCGGEIDVLAESLGTPEAAAVLNALAATLRGDERTVLTRLPDDQGAANEAFARIILDAQGQVLFCSTGFSLEQISSLNQTVSGWIETASGAFFVERMLPAQRLVIFGAGEDARPLARLAAEMGWAVAVAGTRKQQLGEARFPLATQTVLATNAADVPVLASDAVVLMTHSYEQDRRLLAELLPLGPRYLGLLGARHRSALLLAEASELAGIGLRLAVERTHAPIGLELGGDGPEAVALAIVAELQLTFAAAPGQALHSRRMLLDEVNRLLQDGAPHPGAREQCTVAYFGEGELFETQPVITQ
jgi:xanthine dehydrogenase accessory factor